MRVGVLELLVDGPSRTAVDFLYRSEIKRGYASVMPQAVAVWCSQLGHRTSYATYDGSRDPRRLLPDDLDVLFISTYTQSCALAYAVSKMFRADGTLTVIGGPHAKSFPGDCLRFFDWVVQECDKTLVAELLGGAYDRGTVVSSGRPLREVPSVEERMPYILQSILRGRRRILLSNAPLLSSVGCPYTCDFCVDWNNPYSVLPLDQLEADLRYLSTRWPDLLVSFHDPNFGVKFDQVLGVMEKIPRGRRNPYAMESSLSLLKGPRLERLRDTRCVYVAPGVESWEDYSNKSGLSKGKGRDKLEHVVGHFAEIGRHVVGLQANFIFGTDADHGDEPVELTKEFIWRLPTVWPTVNIPTPFGGTPLYDKHLAEKKILRQMPFSFYYTPYLTTVLEHYDPIEYYEKLIDVFALKTSALMAVRRVWTTPAFRMRAINMFRTLAIRQQLRAFRRLVRMLRDDAGFLAFHRGTSSALPEFYHRIFEKKLGRYASLLSRTERLPHLDRVAPAPAPVRVAYEGPGRDLAFGADLAVSAEN